MPHQGTSPGPLPPPTQAHTGWLIASAALAWPLGLAVQLQQPALWPTAGYAVMLAAALAALALAIARPAWRRAAWLVPAIATLAFASTGLRAEARLAQRLAPQLQGLDLVVTGVVADLPQAGPNGLRFQFAVEDARLKGRPVRLPPLLALGWYGGFADDAWLDDAPPDLRAGQRWRLPLRLKQPHGAANPHGFDAELWWFEQGVGATGYVRVVRTGPAAQLLADGVGNPVDRVRQAIRDAIVRQVPDRRAAGVLAALVVGDQAAIDRADWELFRQTGIAHLVAISGVHITMFAWLAGLLINAGWRRSTRLMLWLPAPTAARFGGVLLAAAYALLAGWGVPAQRTVLMLAAAALLAQAGARWPWLLVLLLAGVVVTLADPWALLQAGFWLSFAAVGLLLLSEPARAARPAAGWRSTVWGHLRAQGVASLGLAPLAMVFFQQISVVGLLANLVAIPLVTLLVTPLALAGVLLAPLWQAAAALVQAGVWALGGLAQWPWAVWTAAAAPPWAVACGLAGATLAVLPLPWRLRALAVPLLLPLLAPVVDRPAEGQFELLAADIGQGTAALVRTRQHLLVYDTGPQYSRDSDAGQRVLLPLLRARGERAVDLLMLSHRDTDHVGGAASLVGAFPVRAISSSLADDHPLRQLPPPHTTCRAGQHWQWDGVRFDVLHPTDDDQAAARRPNEVSCVLRVQDSAGRSALLTGDIESPQEAAILRRLPTRDGSGGANTTPLASTVLLVPHHGSKTSSSAAFLDAVAPQVAVVQAGYRSRFGHPAPEVLARYSQRRIMVVRSDECGAWLWRGGAQLCTRQVQRRYWHWNPPAPPAPGGADVANDHGLGAATR